MAAGQNWKGAGREVFIRCCKKKTAEFKISLLTVCRMLSQLERIKETQKHSSTKICAWIVLCCTHRSTKDISLLKNVSNKLKAVEVKSERVVYYSYNIAHP